MSQSIPMRGVAMGAGYFSKFQYEAWTRIPEVSITAIYNRTESKAREMMAAFGIPNWTRKPVWPGSK